jgi:hypothetical protein
MISELETKAKVLEGLVEKSVEQEDYEQADAYQT